MIGFRRLPVVFLALSPLPGCSRLVMQDHPTEFRNLEIEAGHFNVLAVVPSDPTSHDPQIAYRANLTLENEGWTTTFQQVGSADHAAVMSHLCPEGQAVPAYDGVVFVTWDRLELRDCRTHEIAYEVNGGYAGVDRMTTYMLRYLRDQPPPQPSSR